MGKNLVIFAGAGASKAVSSELPTTVEFFRRLPEQVIGQPVFQQICAFLKETMGTDDLDIEHILWALEDAQRDLADLRSGESAAGYLTRGSQTRATIGHQYNLGHEEQIIASLLSMINGLVSDINKQVYDLYSYDPTPADLESNWKPLLLKIWDKFESIDIFTTNYDGVVESALLNVEMSADDYNNYLGLKGNRRKYLDLDEWEVGFPMGKGLLTKLHGSIDWKRNGKKIYVSDTSYAGNHEIHPIIYPGFKGRISTDFFDAFHDYLGNRFSGADTVLFIGFAFRDEHINEIIRDRLSPETRVVVINPDEQVVMPIARLIPTYVPEYFDDAGIRGFMNALKV